MNMIIIGLGSMGKRRTRLVREMYPDTTLFGIDVREDRRKEAEEKFRMKCFACIDAVDSHIDCAFICTSPLSHNTAIRECLLRGWDVFTELNLVPDGYDENIRLAKEKGLTLFLSSTFFYREEIQYIRSRILKNRKWNYIYHIGQYLPDWHPWEDYKGFFLGDKRTNGCREILAIELPWLVDTFGEVADIHVLSDKMTELNIDYKDNFFIQLAHENGNKGCLIVDVVSPAAVRKLEIYGEDRYLSWNGTPDSLMEYDAAGKELRQIALSEKAEHMEGYHAFVTENAYKNEIRYFFDVVLHGRQPLYGFEQDQKVLKLIDTIGA